MKTSIKMLYVLQVIFFQTIFAMQPINKDNIKKGLFILGGVVVIGAVIVNEARYMSAAYACEELEAGSAELEDRQKANPQAGQGKKWFTQREQEIQEMRALAEQRKKYAPISRLLDLFKSHK